MLKTGGHSPWSTMRKDGMAKGLGTLKVISVDRETMSVTVQGRALTKDVLVKLVEAGVCHYWYPLSLIWRRKANHF
jgi:hypothetical protein